jgi:alanine racemase
MNRSQLEVFKDMTDGFGFRRSLAATGGILLGPEYHFDLTRPGIGLYGGAPFLDANPVMHLSLPVIQIHELHAGETVGYGGSWTAATPSRIATIAAGYADGLLRSIAKTGHAWHDSIACPIVGRISMDLIGVDISHLEENPEALDILSNYQTVDQLAESANTIGYEILTSIGSRYARRYVHQ